jgi:hypothetical protein
VVWKYLETRGISRGLKSYQFWSQRVRLLSEKVNIPCKSVRILTERPRSDNQRERKKERNLRDE